MPRSKGKQVVRESVTVSLRDKTVPSKHKQPRKKTAIRTSQVIPSGGSMGGLPSTSLSQSVINPFLGSVCIPDGNDGGCFSIQQSFYLSTDSTGCGAFVITTDPGNLYFANAGVAGIMSFPSASNYNSAQNIATVAQLYSKIRVVSAGCKVISLASTTTNSGFLHVGLVPGSYNPTSLGAPGTSAGIEANTISNQIYPLKDPVYASWRPEDFNSFGDYTQYSSVPLTLASVPSASQQPYLLGAVFGSTPSAQPVRVDFIVNFQGQIRSSALRIGEFREDTMTAEIGWAERVAMTIKREPLFHSLVDDIASVIPGGSTLARMGRILMS